MPEVAFFFDVDGVLVNSHRFQAMAIHESLKQVAAENSLTVQLPSLEVIETQLVGGTEAVALARITKLVPALTKHMPVVVTLAWQLYFTSIQQNVQEFAIQSTVSLLRTLYEIGHVVCLVSNSKRSDVQSYCKLLNLDFVLEHENMIIGAEDFTAPKPAPDPYLVAIDRFGIDPSCCMVFEDSVPGVLAAQAAGTYVIALESRYVTKDDLFDAVAKEVVESLYHAKHLIRHAYTPAAYSPYSADNTFLRVVTMQDQPHSIQENIVDQTFKI
ncbi:protein of unknown function [Taphrina deformans PYCC 5710]|uniref:HAD superfamily hydrolase n=1 Tax=Taphrina deformans (strain PYCC 5710 / ATCC 11124 / CBS 356.35 / IMI 108563 / JCM 9778 / NBRC 8474) TaxID=1097556 RepID=S0BED7_TAPDE|nr:protein of unknown function [Taphrina deformans PYCC 5710]|eukprot:CCG84600.1 protein of unknown function [Taphrina deformans PYCC 5710]